MQWGLWGTAACVCTAVLMTAGSVVAGAWTQPPGSFYIKTNFTASSATEQIKCCVDASQPLLSVSDEGSVWSGVFDLYGEYGLPLDIPGGLTVIAGTSYKLLEIDSERALRRSEGFADINLGLRWGLPLAVLEPVVLALQVDTKIPNEYTANLPEGERIPWLGNGVFEATGSLLVGVSMWPLPIYASGGVGYRYRGHAESSVVAGDYLDYADEVPYSLEIGGTVAGLVLIRGQLDGIAPLGDPGELDAAALTPPASSSLRVGGGIILLLGELLGENVQVNLDYSQVVDGTNVLLSRQLGVGLAWAR